MKKTFYRNRENRIFGGVAGGLAKYLDVDVTILRALFVILTIFGGSGLIIYFILLIITPTEPSALFKETYSASSEEKTKTTSSEEDDFEQKKTNKLRTGGVAGWTCGIIFIFFGLLFLGNSFGLLFLGNSFGFFHFSLFSLFSAIFQLWPFIIIFVGISLIPMNHLLKKILILLSLCVFLGAILFQTGRNFLCNTSSNCSPAIYCCSSNSNSSISFCEMEVQEKAGNHRELSIDIGGSSLSGMTICTDEDIKVSEENGLKIDKKYSDKSKIIKVLKNSPPIGSASIYCSMNPNFVWDIEINAGAGNVSLDLSEYQIKHLEVSSGASNIELILGNKYPHTEVDISSGAANVEISTKKGVGVRLKNNTVLSGKNLNNMFLKDNFYYTPDFESSEAKIFINAEGAISSFTLNTGL